MARSLIRTGFRKGTAFFNSEAQKERKPGLNSFYLLKKKKKKGEEKKTIKVKFLGLRAARSLARVSSSVIIWHLAPLFPALVISREIKMLSFYLPASLCYAQRPREGRVSVHQELRLKLRGD